MEITDYLNDNRVLSKAFELMDIITDIVNRNKNADPFLVKCHLSQITRSSTSIGANISEVHPHLSAKSKYSKLSISLGECYETVVHTRTLYKLGVITDTEYKLINNLCSAVSNMLNASLNTLKKAMDAEDGKKGVKYYARNSSDTNTKK